MVVEDQRVITEIKEGCIKDAGEGTREYYSDYLSSPVYVNVLADIRMKNPANDIAGATLAAQNLMLAAKALGYGTVFCTNSISEKITKEIFRIPDYYKRICINPIGVPVEWPKPEEKKH